MRILALNLYTFLVIGDPHKSALCGNVCICERVERTSPVEKLFTSRSTLIFNDVSHSTQDRTTDTNTDIKPTVKGSYHSVNSIQYGCKGVYRHYVSMQCFSMYKKTQRHIDKLSCIRGWKVDRGVLHVGRKHVCRCVAGGDGCISAAQSGWMNVVMICAESFMSLSEWHPS